MAAAAVTAGLGLVALLTGAGWLAVLSGTGAVAVAVLAVRGPGSPEPVSGEPEAVADETELAVAEAVPVAAEPEPVPVVPGVLDELLLDALLHNRVAVARRTLKPLSVVHLDVGAGLADQSAQEAIFALFEGTLRESDVFGQRSDGIYVVVLADTGEDGAVWTAERLRRGLAEQHEGHAFFAGVACYPSHALEADDVDAKAADALEAAREWHRDRIEVALG